MVDRYLAKVDIVRVRTPSGALCHYTTCTLIGSYWQTKNVSSVVGLVTSLCVDGVKIVFHTLVVTTLGINLVIVWKRLSRMPKKRPSIKPVGRPCHLGNLEERIQEGQKKNTELLAEKYGMDANKIDKYRSLFKYAMKHWGVDEQGKEIKPPSDLKDVNVDDIDIDELCKVMDAYEELKQKAIEKGKIKPKEDNDSDGGSPVLV